MPMREIDGGKGWIRGGGCEARAATARKEAEDFGTAAKRLASLANGKGCAAVRQPAVGPLTSGPACVGPTCQGHHCRALNCSGSRSRTTDLAAVLCSSLGALGWLPAGAGHGGPSGQGTNQYRPVARPARVACVSWTRARPLYFIFSFHSFL